MGAALSAPVINDVCTDVEDPPAFSQSSHAAALPDSVKAAVRSHYADLQPLSVPGADVAAVLAATKRAAAAALPRASVVHEDEAAGALELLDVTRLLRFRDDMAVRVRQQGSGVRVDVRSASRLGKGDLGCNAARIRAFLAVLRRELGLGQQGQQQQGRRQQQG